MNDVERAVFEFVPPVEDAEPDWREVVARAETLRGSGSAKQQVRNGVVRERRRMLAALIVLLCAGIAVATPAFGIGQVITDLFAREDVPFADAPAAASATKLQFGEMASVDAPPGMDPHVIADQTKLAGAFDLRGVKRRVWVAPTATGGFCFVIEHGAGGCHNGPRVRDRIEPLGSFFVPAGITSVRPSDVRPERVDGLVFDADAAGLRLEFEDGRTPPLRFIYVSEPIDAGFFVYKPSLQEQQAGHRPSRIQLLDADGRVIAEHTIDYANEARKAADAQTRPAAAGAAAKISPYAPS